MLLKLLKMLLVLRMHILQMVKMGGVRMVRMGRRRRTTHHQIPEVGHLGGQPLHLGPQLEVLRLQV